MPKTIVVAAAVLLTALSFAQQDHLYSVLQTGGGEVFVDTITLKYSAVTERVPLSGFGGPAQTEDTADLGRWEWPEAIGVYWTLDGLRKPAFNIRSPVPDSWYELPVFDPGFIPTKVKFYLAPGGIEEQSHESRPRLAAFPNPFTSSTTISHQLNPDSRAKLDLFDASGRQVATLVPSQLPTGGFSFELNAHSLSGRRDASRGSRVSFVRLSTDYEEHWVRLVQVE